MEREQKLRPKMRSQIHVAGVAVMALLCALGSPLLGAADDAAPATTKWATFEADGLGLRIELPGRPVDHSRWIDLPADDLYMRVYVLSDAERGRSVTLTAVRLAAVPDDERRDKVYEHARVGIAASTQGKLVDDVAVSANGRTGRAWTIEAGERGFVHVRAFVVGDRYYQVTIDDRASQLDADARRIFASIAIADDVKLIDPPREPDWRWVTPEGESFAVQLPGDPRETTTKRTTSLGEVEVRTMKWEAGPTGPIYTAAAWRLPQPASEADTQRLFDDVKAHLASFGKDVVEEPITVQGRAGRKFTVDKHPRLRRTLHVRAVVAGDRLLELTVEGAKELSANDKKFLESLKLGSP